MAAPGWSLSLSNSGHFRRAASTVLASISFLAGTTYTDHARDQAYRRLAEERRELNTMLLHSLGSSTDPPYVLLPTTIHHTRLLQHIYEQDVDD
jgi:hypothetical protein